MEDSVWEGIEVIMEVICSSLVVVLMGAAFYQAYVIPCLERLM